jgi:crossover junction endodeoxyribonuclease RusA
MFRNLVNGRGIEMPVRKLQRFTEQDVQRVVARRNGGAASVVVAAAGAARVPAEAVGSAAAAVAGGVNQTACAQGYVLMPYPVSANVYWRHFKGRTIVSKEAVAYKARVLSICRMVGVRLIESGPVAVHILLHPKMTKSGAANKTRIDLGNAEKVLSDALNGIAWTDDKQLERILLEVADPIDGGGVSISVGAL